MSTQLKSKTEQLDKKSPTQTLILKRKLALEAATREYETALQKRAQELGKLCLECGLGNYDNSFLKAQFIKLVKDQAKSE